MITWSRKALADLDRIFSHVVQHFHEDKAIEVLEDLKKRLTQELMSFPNIGKKTKKKYNFIVINGNRFYFEVLNSKPEALRIEIVLVKPRGTK